MLDNSPSTANKTIQAEGNGPDGELVVVAKKKKKRCRKKALVASADSTESKLAVDFSNDVRDSESNVADKSKDNIEYEEKLVAPSNNLGPRLKISSFIGTDSIQDTVIPQDELSDSDGGDWISPSSLKPQTQKIQANQQNIKVACITNDFAMQVFIFDENVLLQIGLNLLSTDGMRIKTLRTWVMRCHACYTINLKNETQFCSKCGNNTLLRIAVSVVNGEMKVHLKHDYKYNLRGSVYSIPAPKGGRQRDMVLRGDQKEYLKAIEAKKRLEKLSLKDEDCEGFGRRAEVPVPVVGYGKRNINAVTRGRRRK